MAENLSHSDTLQGYIHNVSPVYHDKYFEFQIQAESETVRAVCFSPRKRKQFAAYNQNNSPVKLKRFKIDTTSNAKDVLIGDDVFVEDCPNINFQKSELPSTMNIAVAKTVRVGQHVTVKAKVANLTEVKKDNSGRFNMVHAVLVDPSSSIKRILWESFVSSVVAGSTYIFSNQTVRKDKFTDQIYLNTAQSGTVVNITDDFQEILAVAPQPPAEYLATTAAGEIIGVESVTKYLSCYKCNKKIQPTKSVITECQNCHLKQKVAATKMHWYATVLFKSDNNEDFKLTVLDTAVTEISSFKKEFTELIEDDITTNFLTLPSVITVTFNSKTKIVTKITIK